MGLAGLQASKARFLIDKAGVLPVETLTYERVHVPAHIHAAVSNGREPKPETAKKPIRWGLPR